MSVLEMWRKAQSYQLWKRATKPALWNDETGEPQRFISLAETPHGNWWLRRPLTMPGSSRSLHVTLHLKQPAKLGCQ
ncbi:MAG: hypothetical protein ACREJU_17005 [Nitrospiraceae bacterium]